MIRQVTVAAALASMAAFLLAAAASPAAPAGGAGFGNVGIAVLATADAAAEPSSVAVEANDGVIVAVGSVELFRVTSTGARSGFGPSHKPVFLHSPSGCSPAVAVDGEARIIVACGSILARLFPSGHLDTHFGNGGIVTVAGVLLSTLALAPGGRLLVGGAVPAPAGVPPSSGALLRFLADGKPDRSFGAAGRVTVPSAFRLADAVAIDGLGRVVVAAGSIFRFDAVGAPDTTFGSSGRVDVQDFNAQVAAVQHDARIVVAGAVGGTAVLRLLDDGSRDASFAGGGIVLPGGYMNATGIVLQPTGGVVVTAVLTYPYGVLGWLVQRLRTDGSIAEAGGAPGFVDPDTDCWSETPDAVAEQSDGKIVVAGFSCYEGEFPQLFAVRYTQALAFDAGVRLEQTRMGRVIVRNEAGTTSVTANVMVNDSARLSVEVRWTQLEPVGPCPPPGAAKPCPTRPEPIGPRVRLAPGSALGGARLRHAASALFTNATGDRVVHLMVLVPTRALWRHHPYVVTLDASDARGRAARRVVLRFTAP